MKRAKRILAGMCSAAIAAALFCSCSAGPGAEPQTTPEAAKGDGQPLGKYEEPLTIKIGSIVGADQIFPQGETAEDNRYTRLIKEKLNIEFETLWQVGTSPDYDQKMNLAIASNELPDAMVVNKVQLKAMAKAKQLVDMTSVIEEYASDSMKAFLDTTKGEALSSASFEGKVMAMPNIQPDADGYSLMWIRKDWLDELQLEVPKTVEELAAAAKAFVDNSMAKEGPTIGLSGPSSGGVMYSTFLDSSNNYFSFDAIFSAMGAYPGYWLEGENGTISYGSVDPKTKEALAFLRKMYADGLIDPEMGVRADSGKTVVNGQAGIFFCPWWVGYGPIPDILKNNPEANWQAYAAPLNSAGEWAPHVSAITNMFTAVKKDFEHPEAIIKLANLLIQEEFNMKTDDLPITFYPLRNTQGPTDEVQMTTKVVRDYLSGSITMEDASSKFQIYPGLEADLKSAKEVLKEPYTDMNIQQWNTDHANFPRMYSMLVGAAPILDTKIYPVKSATYSQTDKMQRKWSTLKKMEDEVFLKIVTGAAEIDAFDQFVTDWKNQGGDEITKDLMESLK